MPPTMILIVVCACAVADTTGEAAIAAKIAAARILRMGVSFGAYRVASFDVFVGPRFPPMIFRGRFRGHEACRGRGSQPGIWVREYGHTPRVFSTPRPHDLVVNVSAILVHAFRG